MKWFVVGFLIYQGQPQHIINERNGPWETKAQCEQWLTSQPSWRMGPDVDDPKMRAGLKQLGYENIVIGCKLIGEQ